MRTRHLPTVLCLAVALVATGAPLPAVAASPATGDAAAARAFAYAADDLQIAVNAHQSAVARAFAQEHFDRCPVALDAPAGAQRRAEALLGLGYFQPLFDSTRSTLHLFVARLARVRTQDPLLAQARAAWRRTLHLVEALPHVDQPCTALAAWRDTGWCASAAPKFDVAAVLRGDDDSRLTAPIARAVRHLRRLGVPARQAARFGGDHLYDAVIPQLVKRSFETAPR